MKYFTSIAATLWIAALAGACQPREFARTNGAVPANSATSLAASGYDLFEKVRAGRSAAENTFIAPLSVQQAMGLVHAGARGQTASEIEAALGLPAGEAADAALAAQRRAVTGDTGLVAVKLANALWLGHQFGFRPDYLEAARSRYDARAAGLDFANAQEVAARTINGWASDNTRGLIKSIVTPDNFDANTLAVLTNAVYFEGEWQTRFGNAVPVSFLMGDGKEQPFPLMGKTADFTYAEAGDWKAVRLPYKASKDGAVNPRFVMDVFLPVKRQAGAMLSAATFADLTARLDKAQPVTVKVTLPRFEIVWKDELNDALRAQGIKAAFTVGQADFSGLVDDARRRLVISRVTHASRLQVFETGTRAAAVTAVEIVVTSAPYYPVPPKIFRVDQPFHLAIRDRTSGTVLFVGRIARPELYQSS